MEYRTEPTLEELLAEPIVLALMKSDGVSPDEARRFFAKFSSRRKPRKDRAKSKKTPAGAFGIHITSEQMHCAAWM